MKYGSDLGWREDAEGSCKLPSIEALEAAMVYGSNEGFGTMPETIVEFLQDAGLYFLIVAPEKRVIPTFWKTSIDKLGWKQGRDYKTLQTHIVAPRPVAAAEDHVDTIEPFIAQLDSFEQENLSFFAETRHKMREMQATIDGLRMENRMLREELASEKDSARMPRTSKTSNQRQSFVLPNDILLEEDQSAQISPSLRTQPIHPTQVEDDSTKRKSLGDPETPLEENKRHKPGKGRFLYRLWEDDEE